MQKLAALIRSRRFLLAVAGVAAIAMDDVLGISQEETLQVAAIVIAWIIGDSVRKTI
jgi:hypothetical protein